MKKRLGLYMVVAFAVALVFFSQKLTPRLRTITTADYLDTVCEISVLSRTDKPLDECIEYLKLSDGIFSAYDESSALFKLNNGEDFDVPAQLSSLVEYGKDFTKENPDYFSIYLEPLSKAWNVAENGGEIPDVATALTLSKEQKYIDLGSIAKGYITENLSEILKKNGVTSAMINLGGNAYAIGKKPTGENWKVGIADPKCESEIVGIITAENIAVITSGNYHRYFEIDQKRYHHILDPKTGYPANNELNSVTIISDNPTLADALSTAAFVAGLDEGIELIKKYNVQGIFITDDTVYFSKSLENIFKQTNFEYKYEFIY